MTLHVCPDILNIPVIPDILEIPTIPEISIIIQISSMLWFQKGMTLYVCSDIPDISDIPEIHTIPEIPIIIQITSKYDTWCQSVSSDIINIPDIPDIPDIPVFPLFLKQLARSPAMQNLEVLASKMAELLQFQILKKSFF